DKLLHFFAGADAVAAMKTSGAPKETFPAAKPLLSLIEQIAARRTSSLVYIQRNGMTLRMGRRHPVAPARDNR
ncbi:MAG: hypothetical protein ACREP5_10270, partial [Candidatus Binatia bacterium]